MASTINRSNRPSISADSYSVAAKALLIATWFVAFTGCQSAPEQKPLAINNQEIADAWHSSASTTDRMEASYREAWRIGYMDGSTGLHTSPRDPARFEAFHSHLREATKSNWSRGYEDGLASARNYHQQQDPRGMHQQAFSTQPPATPGSEATTNNPYVNTPGSLPSGNLERAPYQVPGGGTQPTTEQPGYDPSTPVLQQPAVPASQPTPQTQPEPTATSTQISRLPQVPHWGPVEQAIRQSAKVHAAAIPDTAQVHWNPAFTQPAATTEVALPPDLERSRSVLADQTQTIVTNASRSAPLGEDLISLPKINVTETFAPSTSNPTDMPQPTATTTDLPTLDELTLELSNNTTPSGTVQESVTNNYPQTTAKPLTEQALPNPSTLPVAVAEQPTASRVATAASAVWELPEVDAAPRDTKQTPATQRLATSVSEEAGADHQMVDYQSRLDREMAWPSLGHPRPAMLTQRQRIRNDLPTRLPLKLRKIGRADSRKANLR